MSTDFDPPPPTGGYLAHWLDGHSDDSMERPWSPAYTLGDKRALVPMVMDVSLDLLEAEAVPDFLLDSVKLHA